MTEGCLTLNMATPMLCWYLIPTSSPTYRRQALLSLLLACLHWEAKITVTKRERQLKAQIRWCSHHGKWCGLGGFLAELYAALLPRVIMQSFIHLESFLWESLKSTPRNHYCSPHSSRRVMNKCGYLNWLRIMRPDRSSPVVKISLIYAVFISVFILFTHLAVPALSRGTWAFSLRCCVRGLQLRRADS